LEKNEMAAEMGSFTISRGAENMLCARDRVAEERIRTKLLKDESIDTVIGEPVLLDGHSGLHSRAEEVQKAGRRAVHQRHVRPRSIRGVFERFGPSEARFRTKVVA
jgi:hypothetical protein